MGAKNRDFTFNISLHNAAPSTTYQISYEGAGRSGNLTSIKTDATGKAEASFTLRNGQKATIADLPYECSLKVVDRQRIISLPKRPKSAAQRYRSRPIL